jgi:hypothetical protein
MHFSPVFSVLLICGLSLAQTPLQFEKALPLDGSEMLQPSGLAMVKGNLYLVSCKHDDAVFSVTLGTDKASYKEAFRITRPADAATLKFVWRGIAGDEGDHLLLLSETAYRVLRVDKNGAGSWLGPSVLDAGTEAGLFGGDHSGPDGLTSLSKNKVLIGASRDPRGLIRLDVEGSKTDIKSLKCDKSKVATQAGRKPDFTDLSQFDHTVYALLGSADAVCTFKPTAESPFDESTCWSFATTVQDPKFSYRGLKGIARGLAVDESHVYIALDNKGIARESDPKDRRALLLVFKRPNY